jgi:hypothetical protein
LAQTGKGTFRHLQSDLHVRKIGFMTRYASWTWGEQRAAGRVAEGRKRKKSAAGRACDLVQTERNGT